MNTKFMSNKTLKIIGIIVLVLLIGGAIMYAKSRSTPSNLVGGEYAVAGITNAFGQNLKMVSLLGEQEDVNEAMDVHYKPFVTPELLAEWKANPEEAPGRLTSSPYPEKIEIASVSRLNSRKYRVVGNVVEVANTASGGTETVSVYPITFTFENHNGTWLIAEVEKGQPASPDSGSEDDAA